MYKITFNHSAGSQYLESTDKKQFEDVKSLVMEALGKNANFVTINFTDIGKSLSINLRLTTSIEYGRKN